MKPSPGSERDVLGLVEKRVPQRHSWSSRIALEAQCLKHLYFFGGKQHFAIIGGDIVEIPVEQHEIRYKHNMVRPAVLRAVAKVVQMQGRFDVAPDGPSTKHREIAATSNRVFDHARAATDYQDEKAMAYVWAATCGTSFLKITWDQERGVPDRFYHLSGADRAIVPPNYLTPDQRRDRDLAGLYDDFAPGEIDVEAVSLFQIYVDPHTKRSMSDARWCAQVQYVDREWIGETFGINPDEIDTEEPSSASSRFEDALALLHAGLGGAYAVGSDNEIQRKNRARLVQMWERPSRKHKRGRFVVVAGRKVLRDIDNPYCADQTGWTHLPFYKVDWVPMPGRFWGLSLVEDMTSPQVRYNESRARMAEFERVYGRPHTFVPKGSGIPTGQMTLKPGAVYEFNAALGTPVTGAMPQLPKEVALNAEVAAGEMRQAAAQSDIDSAALPGQMRSGAALRTMQRERDLPLDMTLLGALRVDRDAGRAMLALAKCFYDDERLLKIRGSNGTWSVKAFRASDLATDLRVLSGPGELESPDDAEMRLQTYIELGALQPATNPEDRQLVMKALKYRTTEEIVQDNTQHEERQEEEIRRMIANPKVYLDKPYPLMPFENHAAHMRVLERLFNNLDEMDTLSPEAQSVLVMHWEQHNQAQQAQIAQQLALVEQTKGTPGSKGAASQPSRKA